MPRLDPHSYADTSQPQTRSLTLALRVDFETRTVSTEAALHFREPGGGPLDLDTRDLRIESVRALDGAELPFTLAAPEPILGARLSVQLPEGSRGLRIACTTSPQASALQWLTPAQTSGGAQPFLFSQCQPIHARSLFPLQDTPRVRVTVDSARITVPAQLRALMAAAPKGREPAPEGWATDVFEMPQPIPPYLLAFAVGDLTARQLSARCAVWAERALADAAAEEFSGVEALLTTAEGLFGPYEWERYDILVMPPSFPYGGMENPRLTFATPSLLAGDKSLVNVIAHELAHAWTGNLVTNASANDFWLNEGFTVYAERRILEALGGRELSELHAAAGLHDLGVALERFRDRPQLTRLRTDLAGIDPDEAYSTVPYEKGYLFLRRLEELAGRREWDRFLKAYLAKFHFKSIVTQDFLDFLEHVLPGLAKRADALRWIDQPGLPDDASRPESERLSQLQLLGRRAAVGDVPGLDLTPTELLVYLQALPAALDARTVKKLDALYGLSSRKSLELRHTFVLAQLRAGMPEGVEGARRVALESGRMRYLRPVFLELARRDRGAALRIYEEARESYHPLARAVVEGVLSASAAPR
jgi:aminopeptidase N